MSRRLILTQVDDAPKIYYISSEHKIITPYSEEFGANIVSNNYSGGQGVLKFDAPVLFIGEKAFYTCNTLTSITIPESVTEIGDSAFYGCKSLTSINVPESVTSIGESVFYGCSSLTNVTIPDGVTSIANRVFQNCKSLTSITIPRYVSSIGISAFSGCGNLTNVYCERVTPPTGGTSMFNTNAADRKIYVPMESVEAYKSASYWSNYADAIVGYNFEESGEENGR